MWIFWSCHGCHLEGFFPNISWFACIWPCLFHLEKCLLWEEQLVSKFTGSSKIFLCLKNSEFQNSFFKWEKCSGAKIHPCTSTVYVKHKGSVLKSVSSVWIMEKESYNFNSPGSGTLEVIKVYRCVSIKPWRHNQGWRVLESLLAFTHEFTQFPFKVIYIGSHQYNLWQWISRWTRWSVD